MAESSSFEKSPDLSLGVEVPFICPPVVSTWLMTYDQYQYHQKLRLRTGILEDHLSTGTLENVLLNSSLGNKTVNADVALLAYPMSPRHGLKVVLRIIVRLLVSLAAGDVDKSSRQR